jgi:hypothetical protein
MLRMGGAQPRRSPPQVHGRPQYELSLSPPKPSAGAVMGGLRLLLEQVVFYSAGAHLRELILTSQTVPEAQCRLQKRFAEGPRQSLAHERAGIPSHHRKKRQQLQKPTQVPAQEPDGPSSHEKIIPPAELLEALLEHLAQKLAKQALEQRKGLALIHLLLAVEAER